MSDASPRPRSARSHGPATERHKTTEELAALLHLAELDAAQLDREDAGRAHPCDEGADERHGLGAKLSMDVLEAYERALRAGRRPAVVRLVASVCSGCHVRLHSKLDHQIRRNRGVAPCPHCLRLVYDPAWLAS
jgi:predicted  nucleic acid-binding Zn-ribbon protein